MNKKQIVSFVFLIGVFVEHELNPLPAVIQEKQATQILGTSVVEARGQFVSPVSPTPTKIKDISTTGITADSFLVYDESTQMVLLSKDITTQYSIASLTKLLTALVAYKNLDINKRIVISEQDKLSVSPVLHLMVGDRILPVYLLEAMLVGSANDAALALAHAVEEQTGSSFTYLMNKQAQDLGMTNSNFSNPTGFDSNYNYATAEDVVKLIQATQAYPLFSIEDRSTSYRFEGEKGTYYIRATNKLLSNNVDIAAIKTGFTGEAKGAMAVKVNFNNHIFIILVLHSDDREGDVLKLKSIIEQSYVWK